MINISAISFAAAYQSTENLPKVDSQQFASEKLKSVKNSEGLSQETDAAGEQLAAMISGKAARGEPTLLTFEQACAFPIGKLDYVSNIFECDAFSQSYIIFGQNVFGLRPGKDIWQVTIIPYLFEEITSSDTRQLKPIPGHAINIIRLAPLPGDPPKTVRYAAIEPQLSGLGYGNTSAVLHHWIQLDSSNIMLTAPIKQAIVKALQTHCMLRKGDQYNFKLFGHIDDVDPSDPDFRGQERYQGFSWLNPTFEEKESLLAEVTKLSSFWNFRLLGTDDALFFDLIAERSKDNNLLDSVSIALGDGDDSITGIGGKISVNGVDISNVLSDRNSCDRLDARIYYTRTNTK